MQLYKTNHSLWEYKIMRKFNLVRNIFLCIFLSASSNQPGYIDGQIEGFPMKDSNIDIFVSIFA